MENKEKKSLPKLVISLLAIIVAGVLGVCFLSNTTSSSTDYKEWEKEIKSLKLEKIKLDSVRQKDYELLLDFDNSEKSIDEIAITVAAHNNYVRTNPDYFSKEIRFTSKYYLTQNSEFMVITSDFSKNSDSTYSFYFDGTELGVEPDGTYQYALVSEWEYDTFSEGTKFDIPVLIISAYPETEKAEKMLDLFSNASHVIVRATPDYMTQEMSDTIEKHIPDADIYLYYDNSLLNVLSR